MLLSYTELVELTERKRPTSQAKQLQAMHILYVVRPDGSLAVSKAAVEERLGVVRISAPSKEPELRL
jgi:hypothetical protein